MFLFPAAFLVALLVFLVFAIGLFSMHVTSALSLLICCSFTLFGNLLGGFAFAVEIVDAYACMLVLLQLSLCMWLPSFM